jgi:membrane protease YdiL (CAAX protease family)
MPNQTLRRFAFNRPISFSILVILVSGLWTEIPFDCFLALWLKSPAPEFCKVTIGHILTGIILVGLLVKLGMLKDARFTHPRQWHAVWLVWPFLLFTLLNMDSLISGSMQIDVSQPEMIVLFVVLNLLLKKWGDTRRKIYQSVLFSTLLFGTGHIFNLFTGHLPPLANLTQISYSTAFGVVFAFCFLRNNSIWPVVIRHAAVDFAGGLRHISVGGASMVPVANNSLEAALFSLLISVPLLLYGLFILRKVKPSEGESHISMLPIWNRSGV